jgi:glyoxylase-like metal-dependent hydrolase (beta-lactamase superfamily II)
MCTHLHWDHVGWNTRLADGKWVPTFPKARYVMAKREYDHWLGVHDSGVDTPHARAFGDSILPVVKTGQALLVGDDYALDDGLWFEAYPGHTPGNVVIHAKSGGERGVFIGDVLHHPLQCLKPEWSTMACTDPVGSRVSRTRLVQEHADNGTLVLPAHFPAPRPAGSGATPAPTASSSGSNRQRRPWLLSKAQACHSGLAAAHRPGMTACSGPSQAA